MRKTLWISFSLKNTYRVNGILYSLKQIPLLKRLLPQALYRVRGLKVFANVLSGIWEVLSAFLGKFIYFITMVIGIGVLYDRVAPGAVFLHILLFLTAIGAFLNTHLFNPTRDKYYAIVLMRMDARAYTLINYGYAIIKTIVGFLPFCIGFGLQKNVPLGVCLLLPFFVAGAKLTVSAVSLWRYEKGNRAYNENQLGKWQWLVVGALLAAAYAPPAFGITVPSFVIVPVMLLFVLTGAAAIPKILNFAHYRAVQQQLLAQMLNQMDQAGNLAQQQTRKTISTDVRITSRKKGFAYLNDLFIKRHQKILWKASVRIAAVCLFLLAGLLLVFYLEPEIRTKINGLLLTSLPYFVFIMYALNRGTGFTRALFINCDHSLLTYSFYKQPQMVLQLFAIRLREIIKINLLPAAVIGGGLAVLLYASGGTDNALHYLVLIVSILCMSIFFSVHYLTIYYLLQPYNAGTEMKSGTYQIVLSATYIVCFCMMNLQMPTLLFGILCIAFCVLYCCVACVLIYRFAPKTFRLRS